MATRNARSLLQYWAHPYLADETRQPLPVFEWLGWLGVMLVLSMLGIGMGALAVHLLGHPMPADRAIEQMLMHPGWDVVLMVLFAPILEELVFRAFMTREAKVMSLGLGFVFATAGLVAVRAMLDRHVVLNPVHGRTYFGHVALLVAVALALALLAYRLRRILLRRLIAAAPVWIVLMTLLFAAAHMLNYEQGWKPWLLWLTLPQLLVALVLVYLRVRHGLRWSIASHLAFDWLLIGIAWLHYGARAAGPGGHAALLLLVLVLLALIIYGVAFLFRRGVLRPLPATR